MAYDSAFMKPTMSTSPVESSWTIAGARPSILSKSICIFFPRDLKRKTKSPPDLCRRGLVSYDCAGLSLAGPHRHVSHMMMVMMTMESRGKHCSVMVCDVVRGCQLSLGRSKNRGNLKNLV